MFKTQRYGWRSPLCAILVLLNVACGHHDGGMQSASAAATTAEILSAPPAVEDSPVGYYQYPAVRGDLLVFCAEGDLWSVPLSGGRARRLTTHPGDETNPAISFDGKWIAYTAQYEGPTEVYVIPAAGGLPRRLTYDGMRDYVVGWTRDGRVMFRTSAYSTLPGYQMALVDPESLEVDLLPLAQASQGVFDETAGTLFFTRFAFQGSRTKRYQGGTAQNLWRYNMDGNSEAKALTPDYPGTSRDAMWANGRVYFATDRNGTMNIWSMKPDGGDLKQHTHHVGWDIQEPACDGRHIVYQLGADIHVLDVSTDKDAVIAIGLTSDFDQQREKWVTSPMDYMTAAHISPDGDRVALTARGEVFVAPVGQGRLMAITRDKHARHRDARFLPDGDRVLTLSDESGEVEFWTYPANGIGESKQLTNGAQILRWEGVPSPDGKWLAHHDKRQRLYLYNMETGENKQIDEITQSFWDQFAGLTWSPDSKFLAYSALAPNTFQQVKIYDLAGDAVHNVTSERYDSYSPAWSKDGKWLYFLSDRTFRSRTGSPWGPRAPQPYFTDTTKIYYLALGLDQRSPFAPDDELIKEKKKQEEADKKKEKEEKDKAKEEPKEEPKPDQPAEPDKDMEQPAKESGDAAEPPATEEKPEEEKKDEKKKDEVTVTIEWDGLMERLYEAPVGAANMSGLFIAGERLYWFERGSSGPPEMKTMTITNKDPKADTFASGVSIGELSKDGKKILLRKGSTLYVVDAGGSAALKPENAVNTDGWALNFDPRIEWRQMFTEAWRLERDYFYDPDMHGVDWPAMLDKYMPLVDRVTTRGELSDLIAQMVGEVSALHIFVYGGDMRAGEENIGIATLGARLVRDAAAGGWRVEHIYKTDPDEPTARSPLAEPGVDVVEGDVITMVNGISLADANSNLGALLRYKSGQQVRLRIAHKDGDETKERDVIVQPISSGAERNMRYDEWEYTRRLRVEEKGDGELGYVHLRAMGGGDISQWTRDFFPVFNRKGLIIDVRHNNGGNIDSWILGQLLRRAWMYWSGRAGEPAWNMQYAFRGHLVVLCDESTASDGEAFSEGFMRLGLGKVIGTRTWGGEIWLSSSNVLVDNGIATAAEFGVYGPDGDWLIEGHGVEPDIVIDNLPHATYNGADTQLDAAIDHLLKRIQEEPVDVPPQPNKPNKSSPDNRRK